MSRALECTIHYSFRILFLTLFLLMLPCESKASPQDVFQKHLKLSDRASAKTIFDILNTGVKKMTMQTQKETDAVLKEVKNMGISGGGSSRDIALDVVARMSKKDKDNPLVFAMEEALSLLKTIQPEESPYDLKQRITTAMKATWPNSILKHYFTFPISTRLYPIKSAPELPLEDPSFDRYRTPQTYFDRTFWDRMEVPAAELPEAALTTLFYLIHAPLSSQDRRDVYHNPGSVIARYKERACAHAVDFLSNPERYDAKKLTVRDLEYARHCPEEVKKQVLLSAFQSGWLGAENYLHPDSATSKAVHQELPQTPYGKPRSFPDTHMPDKDGMKTVQLTFQKFWQEYQQQTAGVTSSYDRLQIQKEIQKNYQLQIKTHSNAFEQLLVEARKEADIARSIARKKVQAKATPKPTVKPYSGEKLSSSKALKDPELLQVLKEKKKIQAIKRYRELTGVGLKDAKDTIEDMMLSGK